MAAMQPGGAPTLQVFTEVSATLQPILSRTPDGCIIVDVPTAQITFNTTCQPPLPPIAGLIPFKPYEVMPLPLPGSARIVFNQAANMPPGGIAHEQAHKSGALMEVPPTHGLQAQMKTNSPSGSL
eukprot:TRINITY_DN16223_c0_g1_i1.p1 TRINITY_DN16223_c0_g1~~TRINITY_DN16223_c0_g1_i1.p1  ORF type:complete len:144 (+),score=14.85 TRINITY_DN16223_c0_g1_i1:58-432(+)